MCVCVCVCVIRCPTADWHLITADKNSVIKAAPILRGLEQQ